MSGIDRTSSVKQTRATKDGSSAHNPSKNPKSTPAKVTAPSGYRLRSTPEISSPAVKERLRDVSPDSSKSPKAPAKKRISLKINKTLKPKSSPYATRSLSPLVSILRNGKRKHEAANMIPKFKKRVVGDRDDTQSAIEGIKKEIESDQSSPHSLRKQSRKRSVPVEKSSTDPPKKCKISPDTVSYKDSKTIKNKVSEPSVKVKVKEETKCDASKVVESFLDEPTNRKECNVSSATQNSGDVFDTSLDKSSSCNILGEFSGSHFESENTCSTEHIIAKHDSNNSCDIMFDLSKCDSCLEPVIVDTKENLDSVIKTDGSDATLPEMLYLSDSESSFEKVNETFSRATVMPKVDLDADRCTLDDCSDILSIENSTSSLMACNSTPRRGVSLPPYGPEDETVSVNATCDSLSMLDAEESMNEFMHEISSSKGRENTLDFADSSNDSNQIDATSIIKTLEQTEPLSDDMDTLSKDQGLGTFGVTSKAGGSGTLETVPNVTVDNIVGAIGSSMQGHDLNENLKGNNIHLSVYGGAHVVGLDGHNENYSFDSVDHLHDFSASLGSCERLTALNIEGSSVLNSGHEQPEVSDTYSIQVSQSLAAPEVLKVSKPSESNEVTQDMNDSSPHSVNEPISALNAEDTKCMSLSHKEQDVPSNFPEHQNESLQDADEVSIGTAMTECLETPGSDNSLSLLESESLSALEEHGVCTSNSNEKPQDTTQESSCLTQVNASEDQSGTSSVSGENTVNTLEITHGLVDKSEEGNSAPSQDISSNVDRKVSEASSVPSLKVTDEQLEKSSVCQGEGHPILTAPLVSDVHDDVFESSVSVKDSSEPLDSSPSNGIALDARAADASAVDIDVVGSNTGDFSADDTSTGDINSIDPSNVNICAVGPSSVDISAVDPSRVDISVIDPSSVDISAVDPSSVDISAVDPSSVDVSAVDPSTLDISANDSSIALDANSVLSKNVDTNDVNANTLNAHAVEGPILTNKPSIEKMDVLNAESSETGILDIADTKDNVVSTSNASEVSIPIEVNSESMRNFAIEEKTIESNEPVNVFKNENSKMYEDLAEACVKNEEGKSTEPSAIVEAPGEIDESGKVLEEDATSSESRSGCESVSKPVTNVEEDSAEQLAIKETILNALGLQSSRAASMAKSTVRQELPPIPSRTSGTLKTIIKVPKMADKKRTRNPLRLSLDIHKTSQEKEKDLLSARRSMTERGEISGPLSADQAAVQDPLAFRIFNESCVSPSDSWEAHISKHKSKSHGNSRKFPSGDHLSHLENLPFSRTSINGISGSSSLDWQPKPCQELDHNVPSDGSSNSGRSSQQGSSEGSGEPSLVIPEKSASFSIHPERLCHDVCCYCFGKFGSLDTPMHLAQMKGEEKRRTALALEANLQQDSCLCDACYRYLDRKASCPSYQPYRRQSGVSGGILTKPQVCCVRGCSLPAHHLVRRKWLTRLRRTISKLLPLELTPVPSHQQQPLHAPLCSRHFYCLEYYSLCGICKRKLSRNNMHPVGREVHALNAVLMEDAIPVTLTGKIFLCKMCRYYSGIRLKYRDKSMLSSGHRTFFDGYRKRIWHYLGIQTLDSSEISEPMEIPKKKKKSRVSEGESSKMCEIEKNSRNEDCTANQTAEIISSESGSEVSSGKPGGSMPTKIRFKLGNVSIAQLSNADQSQKDSKEQTLPSCSHRGKSDPSKPKKKTSVSSEMKNTCFPGTEHLGLNASFVFHGNSGGEKNKEWEKCTTTIQFDSKTKKLWQNLYYPYGNFSSFIRHLVMMEKNWRSGDLILAPNASPQAVNYVNSVQNRIAAYEGNSSGCVRSTLPSTSSSGKPVSSRPPASASMSLSSISPRSHPSTSSFMSTQSSVTPVEVAREPMPLLRLPPMVISSKSTTVPHKTTKETHVLPSPSVVPRISLANSQISPRVQTIAAPVTAQLIPVSAATNFMPMTCVPNQFISFGSTSSFIQLGGPSGLVHPVGGPYPCVQFNQQIMTDKLVVDKGGVSGGQRYLGVKNPSSSLAELELHISNVRSLANDAGSNNAWEQQSDKQILLDDNACTSDSATQSSGRSEEHSLEVNSVGSAASLSTGTLSLETSDNHSDEAVGNSTCLGVSESQVDIFEIV